MSTGNANIVERNGRLKKLLAVSAIALVASASMAMPARADLASVGNVDPVTKFPSYFGDANQLQLEICVSGPGCAGLPAVFGAPDGEAFWYSASSDLATPNDGTVSLEFATEAAYAAPGDGQEIAFNRFRVVGKGVKPGFYRVTTPYGQDTVEATAKNGIKFTDDRGCMGPPCGAFGASKTGFLGPNFLTWDTLGNPDPALAPPTGFIGDSVTPHKVSGSVLTDANGNLQNYFRLEEVDGSGNVIRNLGTTDLFTVQGKVHGTTAFASEQSGSFKADQSVSLTPSVQGAEVRYTTDPAVADADIATSGTVFGPADPPIKIGAAAGTSADTTLRYVAIDPATGTPSPVLKQTYTIDKAAPAAPSVDLTAASDTGSSRTDNITQDTTPTFVGTAEAGSTVKLFNGTRLVGTGAANATGKYNITTSKLINGVRPISAKATDGVGNVGAASGALQVRIDSVKPVIPPASLSPAPGSLTLDRTPLIKAVVRDSQTNLAKPNIKLFIDTVPAGFNYVQSTDRLSATSRALAPGRHRASIVATDTAGNQLVKPWFFTLR